MARKETMLIFYALANKPYKMLLGSYMETNLHTTLRESHNLLQNFFLILFCINGILLYGRQIALYTNQLIKQYKGAAKSNIENKTRFANQSILLIIVKFSLKMCSYYSDFILKLCGYKAISRW